VNFHIGSYVVHKKLDELGSGEIIKSDLGTVSIRFASGVRNFSEAIVGAFLEKTTTAPVMPPPTKRKAAAKKKKPAVVVAPTPTT
jgi:hypothetical protein